MTLMSELDDLERDGMADDFEPKHPLHYHRNKIEGYENKNGGTYSRYGTWLELADVQAVLLEMYAFAIDMGYETKLLNILALKINNIQKGS